ncbi:MAG: hypothetical protein HC871_01250 [Rhizobiales bacterium]|nr:hypothetical protein [Hyphomicrobiales bacterium]
MDVNEKNKSKVPGGVARANSLSAQQRREIAQKAAAARWGHRATHIGNFKKEFGLDVDCYVLNDEEKTAVISQRGLAVVLGFTRGGGRIPRFMRGKKIAPYIGLELRQKLENPIVFQSSLVGPKVTIHGYRSDELIDICKAIVRAGSEGALQASQKPMAKQAQIIINASAKRGIQDLVYTLSGYDATREERIAAFKLYVAQEAREYEKEFPSELYSEWYRLYQLIEPPKGRPWNFKHLTVKHVYWPLAKSSGRILDLTRAQRSSSADRHKKLHQFLSEIGVKALRQHLGQLLGIAQLSDDQAQYEKNVRKIFGDQLEFDV